MVPHLGQLFCFLPLSTWIPSCKGNVIAVEFSVTGYDVLVPLLLETP